MKKLCFLLILALLLGLGASAFADNGVEIIMDGIPVVMESVGFDLSGAETFNAAVGTGSAGFLLPEKLVTIEDSAFEGIAAASVEITANVKTVGARAFADSPNLHMLIIPDTVVSVDNTALEGCTDVIVIGASGSEAERFAEEAVNAETILFLPTNTEPPTYHAAQPPVVMPFVAFPNQ